MDKEYYNDFLNFLIKKGHTKSEAKEIVRKQKIRDKALVKLAPKAENMSKHYNFMGKKFGKAFNPKYKKADVAKKGKVLTTDISYTSIIKNPKIVALGRLEEYETGRTKVYYCEK